MVIAKKEMVRINTGMEINTKAVLKTS